MTLCVRFHDIDQLLRAVHVMLTKNSTAIQNMGRHGYDEGPWVGGPRVDDARGSRFDTPNLYVQYTNLEILFQMNVFFWIRNLMGS